MAFLGEIDWPLFPSNEIKSIIYRRRRRRHVNLLCVRVCHKWDGKKAITVIRLSTRNCFRRPNIHCAASCSVSGPMHKKWSTMFQSSQNTTNGITWEITLGSYADCQCTRIFMALSKPIEKPLCWSGPGLGNFQVSSISRLPHTDDDKYWTVLICLWKDENDDDFKGLYFYAQPSGTVAAQIV